MDALVHDDAVNGNANLSLVQEFSERAASTAWSRSAVFEHDKWAVTSQLQIDTLDD